MTEYSAPLRTRNLGYDTTFWRVVVDAAYNLDAAARLAVAAKWAEITEYLTIPFQLDGMYIPWEAVKSSWRDDEKLKKDPRRVVTLLGHST